MGGTGLRSRLRFFVPALCASLIAALAAAAPASAAFGYLSSFGTFGTGDGQFVDARGVAVGADGNLYVADSGNSRVQVVDPSGTFVRKWGGAGTGDGQFKRLIDVAVGGSGNVYTAEQFFGGQGRNLIQKFDSAGTFLTKWGTAEFNWIAGVAVDGSDNVYVADGGASVVKKFNSNGELLTQWGEAGAGVGQFRTLSGITVDTAGNVYTLEAAGGPTPSTQRVQKFDPTGAPKADFVDGSGNPTSTFSIGSGLNTEAYIPGIDVDAAGFIYVAGGGYMLRFTPTGAQAERVTDCQTNMLGVAAYPNGKVYAGGSSGVLVFGEGGTSCGAGAPGAGAPGAGAPAGLVFEGDEGVTINGGAQFTNDPAVQLTIEPPANATQVRLANDGGFISATTRPVSADRLYAWTLDSSGLERLPKTVYVRFANEAESSPLNFTDDIILDQTAPKVTLASLTGGGGVAAAAVVAAATDKLTLRVSAKDNVSGVSTMQLARKKSNPGKLRKYKQELSVSADRPPRYVRVSDGATNLSEWRRIKRR